MAIPHRKLLGVGVEGNSTSVYACRLSDDCGESYMYGYCLRCAYIPPPPPPPVRHKSAESHVIPYLISAVCALGVAFLILTTCTILLRYGFSRGRRGSSSSSRRVNSIRDSVFLDEDRGPVIDHPIWQIVTVGLPPSVIDSIATFKYKRGEGLIEGADCSVCLTEFEEDDDLRLLPKCSHAFHLPCIDTWLSSHKTCPLCRAPVMTPNLGDLGDLGSSAATQMESSESQSDQAGDLTGHSQRRDDLDSLPIEGIRIAGILKRNRENRVLSDLGDNYCRLYEDFQPVRRSVSLDASAASAVYAVAGVTGEGSSHLEKRAEVDKADKIVQRDSSVSRLIKSSSSIGRSLQKAPVSMKRSLSSSSAKIFSSFRGSKSQPSSILPL